MDGSAPTPEVKCDIEERKKSSHQTHDNFSFSRHTIPPILTNPFSTIRPGLLLEILAVAFSRPRRWAHGRRPGQP
jgi:hypothetical protein